MSESVKQRGIFPEAFKREAVAAVRGGRSVSQVAAELGLPDRLVRSWLRWADGRAPAASGALAPKRPPTRKRGRPTASMNDGPEVGKSALHGLDSTGPVSIWELIMRISFVCGCPRSGTTALAQVLNVHPRICIGIERYKAIAIGRRGAEFGPELFTLERFSDIREDDTNIKRENERLLRKFDGRHPIQVIGDKTPRLYVRLPFLRERFPGSSLVFILRDPMEVARSWQKRADDPKDHWPAEHGMDKALTEWVKSVEAMAAALPIWGEDATVIDYARFFNVPTPTALSENASKLYQFLGLRMRPENLQRMAERFWREPAASTSAADDGAMAEKIREALSTPGLAAVQAAAL
jgi:hypothetical protein